MMFFQIAPRPDLRRLILFQLQPRSILHKPREDISDQVALTAQTGQAGQVEGV
jgi:hypothetical protein